MGVDWLVCLMMLYAIRVEEIITLQGETFSTISMLAGAISRCDVEYATQREWKTFVVPWELPNGIVYAWVGREFSAMNSNRFQSFYWYIKMNRSPAKHSASINLGDISQIPQDFIKQFSKFSFALLSKHRAESTETLFEVIARFAISIFFQSSLLNFAFPIHHRNT